MIDNSNSVSIPPINFDEFYEKMLRIRVFEEHLLKLYSRGVLRGTVHTCIGQEACAVGVIQSLRADVDIVCSNHRGHGHFLAFENDMPGLLAEIMGLSSGVSAGVGGSQHLHKGNFYSNGILGGMSPVATGFSLAQKLEGQGGISVVFSGDGGMSEGVIYESLNIAALWSLPLLLVVEHNGIAQSTPWTLEHGSPIEGRPPAFGVPTYTADGNDVEAVYQLAAKTITGIRETSKPACLVLFTTRLAPHSKGDDTRTKVELAELRKLDPIERVKIRLAESDQTAIAEKVYAEIDSLVNAFSEY